MESLPRITDNTSLKRRKGEIVREDHTCVDYGLSEFSDDILINVLSHLTIKEAVKTSILSRRWRYLWKWFTGCLNFDNLVKIPTYKFENGGRGNSFDVDRQKFVSLVNQVLRSLRAQTVEELRIRFDVRSKDDIHNWIKFSVENKVQTLELDFFRLWGSPFDVVQHNFSQDIVTHSSFSCLTSLILRNVDITGEVLERFLSYCPLLEVLSVSCSLCLRNLKVSGSTLKLRHLKVNYVKNLEIQAPNLISLEFDGPKIPISFRNVPNLSEVSFGRHYSSYVMRNFFNLSILVRLQRLKLNLASMEQMQRHHQLPRYYNIPELYNLKHLEMDIYLSDDISLLPCAAFLNASTSLYKFTLKLTYVTPLAESARSVKDCLYSTLSEYIRIRELEVVGFVGHVADTDFITYVIKSAGLLEKVIIDPCKPWSLGIPQEPFLRECEDIMTARTQAIQLAARFPSLEFVIL